MGTSHSPAALAGKLTRLEREYQDLPLSLVKESSLLTKTTIKALAPARLRGVGKKGRALDVKYNVIGGGGEYAASLVFARGPWQLIEWDTRAHRIPRERGGRARQRWAVFPNAAVAEGAKKGTRVRAFANHPGTQGKHPWEKGVLAARKPVAVLFQAKHNLALRRIF